MHIIIIIIIIIIMIILIMTKRSVLSSHSLRQYPLIERVSNLKVVKQFMIYESNTGCILFVSL